MPGGVELTVLETLKSLDQERFEPYVCVTGSEGLLHAEYCQLATPVSAHNLCDLDVVNIYNHFAWAADFMRGEPRCDVIHHIYMHFDTLVNSNYLNRAFLAFCRHAPRYRRVVCDSTDTAARIVQIVRLLASVCPEKYHALDNVRIISHGVSGTEEGEQDPGLVLWVGAPTWTKGFDLLPEIAAHFSTLRVTAVLKTAPDENTHAKCKRIYRRLQEAPNVTVLVGLSQREVARLMATHGTFLVTSRREGASRALAEARTAGTTCISMCEEIPPPADLVVEDISELW